MNKQKSRHSIIWITLMLTTFLLSIGMATVPAAALAHVCSVSNDFHCYSIVYWSMKKPEEVRGAYDEIETFYADVPNYGTEYLDNEMWVAFPQMNEIASVEAGVTYGFGTGSPTTGDYFYARTYSNTQYAEYIYPGGAPLNTWIGVYIDEPAAAGTWCITWQWYTSPDACWSGFSSSSTELQNGLEFATTVASGADDNGRNSGWGQWMNGSWHHEWNDGTTHAEYLREKPLCINAPASGYTWGSVAYAAPGC